MKLLFLNSLKGLRRKKIQMFGIILMVTLSTGIYVAMNSALDRMEEDYYNYLEDQNVEYLSVDTIIDYKKDITKENMDYLLNHELSNLTEEENSIIQSYICAANIESCAICYAEDPFSNPAFSYSVDKIFQKYEADLYIKSKKITSLQEKYNFEFELDRSKSLKVEDTYLKVIPYKQDKNINKAYLVEGELPTNNQEITMLPKYAEIHNIEIGDYYKIGDIEYKVVGYAYAPDYIYPLVSYSAIMFDEEKNNVIYVNEEDFKNINGVEEKTFSILYHGDVKRQFEITAPTEEEIEVEDDNMMKIFYDETSPVTMSIFTVTRLGRVASLQLEFATNRLFAEYFLYLLLGVAVFVIAIITKKRIEDERLQIGVLKSLGYNPFSIAVSYLVYPIIGSLIGGILGYIIGSLVSIPLSNNYLNYFLVPLSGFQFDLKYLIHATILPMVLLSILSYIIAIFMLRKKPLALLKEGSNLKINIFSKIANKLTSFLPFKYRFKYNLAFRSIPKLLIVALTSFFTGMLIVLTLIGVNLMNNLVDSSFSGLNYDYMIYTNAVETEQLDENADYLLDGVLPIVKVLDENNKEKKLEEELTLTITGIDTTSKYIKVLNEKEEDIKNKLTDEDGIIINRNLQNLYDVQIGDTLVFALDEEKTKTISYKVIDISEEFMNLSGYVNRTGFSKKVGYDTASYTSMLSSDDKYSDLNTLDTNLVSKIATVLNFKDMKENIQNTMEQYNVTIYAVILFASVMAFVIILVIANIVVEENKKIISLMKVIGYKNKKISSIVLNVYTPIIIISYLLSIPAMIKVLEKIVSVLAGDMEMTIPITLSPSMAVLGLIGLLVAYYIAVAMSKRVLNKIPLSIALKRE